MSEDQMNRTMFTLFVKNVALSFRLYYIGCRDPMNFTGEGFFFFFFAKSEIYFLETRSTGSGLEKIWIPTPILLLTSYVYSEVNKSP